MLHRLTKKFRGWVYPQKLLQQFTAHYDYVHRHRHSSLVGPVIGLRLGAHIFTKPIKNKTVYHERFVYVGCVHGGNEDIYKRLEALSGDPPDYLIFTGDITGSAEMERYKNYFYDKRELDPKGQFAKFSYFGYWAATLPKFRRKLLLSTLRPSAERLLKILNGIKKKGTKILLVEGNWDNPLVSAVKIIAGEDIKNVFDTNKFFKINGYKFIDNLSVLKTKTTLHVFLPFITILYFDHFSKYKIKEIQKEIIGAQYQNKTVIMVGHAEANWTIHHLSRPVPPVGRERIQVIHNFSRAMALFRPHEVIYPHQHARIRDEKEHLLSLEAKYLLQIVKSHDKTRDGYVRLVNDINKTKTRDGQIIATYIPYGYLGEEEFVKE